MISLISTCFSVAARFSDSLHHLLESMSKCNPWFIRCIKPNNDKAPMKFDMPVVLEQLRYTGMLDTIRIRQSGYPVRMKFHHFVDRYRQVIFIKIIFYNNNLLSFMFCYNLNSIKLSFKTLELKHCFCYKISKKHIFISRYQITFRKYF